MSSRFQGPVPKNRLASAASRGRGLIEVKAALEARACRGLTNDAGDQFFERALKRDLVVQIQLVQIDVGIGGGRQGACAAFGREARRVAAKSPYGRLLVPFAIEKSSDCARRLAGPEIPRRHIPPPDILPKHLAIGRRSETAFNINV